MIPDAAVLRARRVVGLYGDPTVSWSIVLEARLSSPVYPDLVRARLARATTDHPHLGVPPTVTVLPTGPVADPAPPTPHAAVPGDAVAASDAWAAVRADAADRPYDDREPLIRAAVEGERLLVAAHHGVVDGFGLLALLGIALDAPVSSGARGIGARPATRTFLTSAALRLAEALFTPPSRAGASGGPGAGVGPDARAGRGPGDAGGSAAAAGGGATGDALATLELRAARLGSAALTAATATAIRDWNRQHGVPTRRVVSALGASRRPGTALAPDRRTAFFRLLVPAGADAAAVRGILAHTPPEPDFPESHSSPLRPLIKALTNRLGATFLVSNLGPVITPAPIAALSFYPAATGRSGIAVGATTCGEITTITVRARRTSFDDAAAAELLRLITAHLPR